MNKVIIIAEAGVNHNGSLTKAKKLIDIASKAGADFVKFQTYKTEEMTTKNAIKTPYQKKFSNEKSQFKMLKDYELSESNFIFLRKYCVKKNIKFLSSPFDIKSATFLNKLKMKYIKIPSGEITNYPLIEHIAGFNKDIILSTGMSIVKEIHDAIMIFKKNKKFNKSINLLHCTSAYPTPFNEININAMLMLKNKFKLNVGLSDHSIGEVAAIAAISNGANFIEKHFTINKNLKGPDHKSSLAPAELCSFIDSIRIAEKVMGDSFKSLTRSETKNIKLVRKSIVAKTNIKIGDNFTDKNLTVKRPAYGISPMNWNKIIGKKSKKNYKADAVIKNY